MLLLEENCFRGSSTSYHVEMKDYKGKLCIKNAFHVDFNEKFLGILEIFYKTYRLL